MITKPTTALRKIAGMTKRFRGVQGGQGAGKTYAILLLIINHLASTPDRECVVVGAELTKMKKTVIKDFIKILRDQGLWFSKYWNGTNNRYAFLNESFINFVGLDRTDIGKGFRTNVLYLFEANMLQLEAARQFISRSGIIFADWNPDSKFWFHEEYLKDDDVEMIVLTYEDNECINEHEKKEILSYQEKGYYPDGTVKNTYWANRWQVYGLGNPAISEDTVFPDWKLYKDEPDDSLLDWFHLGGDFGYKVDPTACISVKKVGNRLYLKEILYETGLLNSAIANRLTELNLNTELSIWDKAEEKSIFELRAHNVNAWYSDKGPGSISFGIQKLHQFELFVHEDSLNLQEELTKYKWAKDRNGNYIKNTMGKRVPIDEWNHGIDAIRYVILNYYWQTVEE